MSNYTINCCDRVEKLLLTHKAQADGEDFPVYFELAKVHPKQEIIGNRFCKISIVMSGKGQYESAGISLEANRHSVFIIPAGTSYSWIRCDHLQLLNIRYDADWFASPIEAVGDSSIIATRFFASHFLANLKMRQVITFSISSSALDCILDEMGDLHTGFQPDRGGRVTFKTACFLKMISVLAAEYAVYYDASGVTGIHPAVRCLMERLDQNICCGEKADIAYHAAQMGISLQHLSRMFASYLGVSPLKYFSRRRLERAKCLLSNSALNITDVAHQLGFSDSAYLCRKFKEAFNLTPMEFRKHRHTLKPDRLFSPTSNSQLEYLNERYIS